MPIIVGCECGARYKVPDKALGRVIRCKKCEHRLLVKKQESTTATEQKRAAVLPEEPSARDGDRTKMMEELEKSQRESSSAASNPGMLRVSYWRHFLAYPKWALIWHFGFLGSVALTVLHPAFVLLIAFFGFAIVKYWQRVKTQFIAGCVNPALILSVNPPLIAVGTDLRQSANSYLVVKVLAAPIHRMVDGPPSEKQRIATASFYGGAEEELDRWTDFYPKIAASVTSDSREVKRMLRSIEKEDWDELAEGILQMPQPPEPGLYRTYPLSTRERSFEWTEEDIAELIEEDLGDLKYCQLVSELNMLPHETFGYIPKTARNDVIAVIESAEVSADLSQGLALTSVGVFYNFEATGKGAFKWQNLIGAFCANGELELAFMDESRIAIPQTHFLSAMRVALEMLCNEIGRGG